MGIMLTRLNMRNVRRHADTTIDFGIDEQLVLFDGGNGAGKTTILEAIQWALFGYTRHGRSGLSKMVRRGGEHEGMDVELCFTRAQTQYIIRRRWEKGQSSATLFANGVETHRTVAAVNAEVANIFGTDVHGFLLSSVATQTDRAELTSMSGAARRAAVTRLFRYDAFASAKSKARDMFTSSSAKVSALNDVVAAHDVSAVEKACKTATAAEKAAEEANQTVAKLDALLAASADADAAYTLAAVHAAEAEARAEAARQNAILAETEAAQAERNVPKIPPKPEMDLVDVSAALLVVADQLTDAVVEERTAEHLAVARRALQTAQTKLANAEKTCQRVGTPSQAAEVLKESEATLAEAQAAHIDTLDASVAAAAEVGAAEARVGAAYDADVQAKSLDALCQMCGQPVDDKTRHAQHVLRETELATAREELVAVTAEAAEIDTAASEAAAAVVSARTKVAEASKVYELATRAEEAYTSAQSECADLEATAERLAGGITGADASVLRAEQARLGKIRDQIGAFSQAQALAAAATKHATTAKKRATDAREKVVQADREARAAQVPDDIAQAAAKRAELIKVREAEKDFASTLAAAAASAQAKVQAAKDADRATEVAAHALAAARTDARIASKASNVLARAATLAAAAARPKLQGEIASLLSLMSNGRFSQVEVSQDYEVKVRDIDGAWMALSEYSGGEQDLIALAVRLALARHVSGSTAGGFLILDEVFGSQDVDRCDTIVAALRQLRHVYGQILVISHVGGLAEGADRVVTVSWDRDENISTV